MKLNKNEEGKYTGSAYFSRKVPDLKTLLEDRAWCEERKLKPQTFVIEKIIYLDLLKYEGFCMELLDDNKFIEENKELMEEDKDGIWHCILVRANTSYIENLNGILINSEGYDYARYAYALGDAAEGTCFE